MTLWIGRSGNGFADPVTICGTPAVTDIDSIRLADLLGDGVAEVLWSTASGVCRQSGKMFFFDFTSRTPSDR